MAVAFTANAADEKKVDATGAWKWTQQGGGGGGGGGGQPREVTLTLKMEGEKLAGSISGRQNETPISEATIKGDEISFKVVREFNGTQRTQKYTGKIAGDTITGKIESERDGQTQSRDWTAKKEAKKEGAAAATPAN
jgi:hypothetical protein